MTPAKSEELLKRTIERVRASKPEGNRSVHHKEIDWLTHVQRGAGNLAIQQLHRSSIVQPKLNISQPGDIYEEEADHVATEVVQMNNESCHCGGACSECRTDKQIQGYYSNGSNTTSASHLGSGQPLDHETRSFFESRFGQNFSNVRVHADAEAAESAKAMNARAYTLGRDVVFGKGQYAPQTTGGKRIIAHELMHTIQQANGPDVLQRQSSGCEYCKEVYDDCISSAEWHCMWGMFGRGVAGGLWGGAKGFLMGGLLSPVLAGVGAVTGAAKGVFSGIEGSEECMRDEIPKCKEKYDKCWEDCQNLEFEREPRG